MPPAARVDSNQLPRTNSRGPWKKPFPSCDACKLRRVKCDSVALPGSCSRCISKGIKCTTQTTPRRNPKERMGRRIEQARSTYGKVDEPNSSSTSSLEIVPMPAASVHADSSMVENELTGELTAHLLYLYEHMPRARMFPCTFVFSAFEAAGRRLNSLPPSTQTLVLAIAATTARISSHPALLGPGLSTPELSTFFVDPMRFVDANSDDASSAGKSSLPYAVGSRRENACEQLREKALEHAWARRISRVASTTSGGRDGGEEAMATCFLLRFLEHPTYCELHDVQWRPNRASERGVWSSAFVSQLRLQMGDGTLVSRTSEDCPKERQAPSGDAKLRWSVHIMRESVTCAAYDDACQYTLQDEVMLAGPPPLSPEETLANANGPDDAQWWDTQMFYALVRPYTYQMTQIALNNFDWSARRRTGLPFSLPRLRAHVAALKPLHTLLALAHARFAVAFGTEATATRVRTRASYGGLHTRHGTAAAHAQAAHRRGDAHAAESADREAAQAMLGAMESAMAHVNIPIWVDVEARLGAAGQGRGREEDVATLRVVMSGLRRALLPYVMRMLGQMTSVGDGGFIESKVSLAALTQLGDEPAKFWTWVILSSIPIENGGEGITRAQKLQTLESVHKIYKVISWAWPRVLETDTAIRVKTSLEVLRLEHMFDEIYGSGTYPLTNGPGAAVMLGGGSSAGTPESGSGQAVSSSSTSACGSSSASSQHHTPGSTPSPALVSDVISQSSDSSAGSSAFDLPDIEAVLRSTGVLDEAATSGNGDHVSANIGGSVTLRATGSELIGVPTADSTSTVIDPGGVSLDLMVPYLTSQTAPSMQPAISLPEPYNHWIGFAYDAYQTTAEQSGWTV